MGNEIITVDSVCVNTKDEAITKMLEKIRKLKIQFLDSAEDWEFATVIGTWKGILTGMRYCGYLNKNEFLVYKHDMERFIKAESGEDVWG